MVSSACPELVEGSNHSRSKMGHLLTLKFTSHLGIILIEAKTMIQDNNLMNEFNSLPPDQQTEVIDFIKRLKAKEKSVDLINLEDDPILQVAGCVSGPPILTSEAIDKELYGE